MIPLSCCCLMWQMIIRDMMYGTVVILEPSCDVRNCNQNHSKNLKILGPLYERDKNNLLFEKRV